MDEIIEILETLLKEDLNRASQAERLLQGRPEGRLDVTMAGKVTRYYWVSGKQRRYLGKSQRALIKSLAEKKYYRRILVKIQTEIETIRSFLDRFNPHSQIEVYEKMPEACKHLLTPLVLPDDAFLEQWLAESKILLETGNITFQKTNDFRTLNGEYVRSKSEMILANTFRHYSIIYCYECPLHLNRETTVYPDFRLLNKRTRKTYYWEHFGMLDDPEYLESALLKIHRYMQAGIYPFDQLIITWETSKSPLKMSDVELFINRYLL
ncbi:MAG: hypothetical protein IJU49_07595 [Lachnospiraceae bacterium]|nr:hypothetical protein [Lachnospiraceae bacterium]